MKYFITLLLEIALATGLRSQSSGQTSSDARLPSLWDGLETPQYGDFKLNAGLKSLHNSGRGEELQTEGARRYYMRNEYFVGTLHTSGWGATAMAVTTGMTFQDSRQTAYGAGDPSLTIIHPALFENLSTRAWGQFRHYYPVSDYAVSRNQKQYAYYLFATYRGAHGFGVFNQLTPRYFNNSLYKDFDTTGLVEDYTKITRQLSSWFKYGLGQHTQIEWHANSPMGTVVEIYPLANITLNKNIFIEPHLLLPLYKVNAVYDSPKSVSLNNFQLELYAQISI